MKKQLLMTTALLSSSVALAGVEFSGEGFIRHEVKNNADFLSTAADRTANTPTRFRLNVKGMKSENSKFHIFLQPQYTDVQGTTSGGLANPGLSLHQATINYAANDYFKLTAGRMEVNLGDQLVFGGVGWSNQARAFDGVSVTSKCLISGTNTFFALKQNETDSTTTPAVSEDFDVYGIYHAQSIGEMIKEFDLYYFKTSQDTVGSVTDLNTFGLRLKDKKGAFDYRVEFTAQSGEQSSTKTHGSQYDAEIGYTLSALTTRIGFEYFSATENYNELYPTGHKWLGYADLFKRKNIKGMVAHLSMKPMDKLTAKVDYHLFSRENENAPAYKFAAGGAYGTAGTNTDIASEIDLTLKYALEDGLSIMAGYSIVSAGDYLKDQGAVDDMNFSYLQLKASF